MYTRRSIQPSMFLVVPAALALGWAATVAAADVQKFPATGQTECVDRAGHRSPCAGEGQDGEIEAGATLRYRDNLNGTITDRNTLLVWEKKSDDDGIHDKDNGYSWNDAFAVHVAALNNSCQNDEIRACTTNADCAVVGGKCGFAGKRDWRVPNVKELQSIINYGEGDPAVSATFYSPCVAGRTVVSGSCTAASFYWSSTSYNLDALRAWAVDFNDGRVLAGSKSFDPQPIPVLTEGSLPTIVLGVPVRAVRGGL